MVEPSHSINTNQGPVPHQDMASQRLLRHRRHLPRYPEGPVGRRHDAKDGPPLAAGTQLERNFFGLKMASTCPNDQFLEHFVSEGISSQK